MRHICVNCGTETQNYGYYCPRCLLYVQVSEVPENWKITIQIKQYLEDVDKEHAQEILDRLVASICALDSTIVIDDEYLEEQ